MHDYYSILRVPQNANSEILKQAYRKRAVECHPDRGGSHEQMILVNEAWLILSNPNTRSHYDSAIKDKNNGAAQRAAQKDAQENQQKAQDYPKKWADFNKWLNANYGSTSVGMGMKVPTGGNSVSRWIIIIAGGSLGLFLAGSILSQGTLHHLPAIGISFIVGGAWLGVYIHHLVSQ
jgi:curved DNA-binding protein CbpA